ncbi:DUF2795 domain-containing protein [Streptomyces griseus]|nr:DUF2795 domain-containing protein [Streptomyces griseus]
MNCPTDKQHLVERVRQNKADEKVVSRLDGLKQDHFDGPNEVRKAFLGQ